MKRPLDKVPNFRPKEEAVSEAILPEGFNIIEYYAKQKVEQANVRLAVVGLPPIVYDRKKHK